MARAVEAVFDADYYLGHSPDVAEAGVSPLRHYLTTGWIEGRDPSPYFRTEWYLDTYPDVDHSGRNPLVHYLAYGAAEGRHPSPAFDAEDYLTRYADVAETGMSPLLHFVRHGREEGRFVRPLNRPSGAAVASAVTPAGSSGLDRAFEAYGEYQARPRGNAVLIEEVGQPRTRFEGTLAVHLHLHYGAMAWKFVTSFVKIGRPFDLFVSIGPDVDASEVTDQFGALPCCRSVVVERFENKGRDIGPFVAGFGERLLAYDLIAHVHSKRSPHNALKRDWATQLLHHLFATPDHVDQLLGRFAEDRELGLVFPVYHSSLSEQIHWGTNFEAAQRLAHRLGQDLSEADFEPFPAGSFFVARSEALRPLLGSGITFADFPPEDAQIDGTLAHAIERLVTLIVRRAGFGAEQVASSKPHTLSSAYIGKSPYRSVLFERTKGRGRSRPKSRIKTWPESRVCVFTCSTGGYDRPLPPENVVDGADYLFFSDEPIAGDKGWTYRKTRYWNPDPVKIARFYKANAPQILAGYDIAVWVDANIAITGDIAAYVDATLSANANFGVIDHPYRNSVFEEVDQLAALGRDDAARMTAQVERYREKGYEGQNSLTETNFIVMDLNRPRTREALSLWWKEIETHSKRDQVSFDYACWRAGAKQHSLFPEGGSVRSNPDFAYFKHGADTYPYTDVSVPTPTVDAIPPQPAKLPDRVQISVCVHNALDDVKACLESVSEHVGDRHEVLVIDDNSGADTRDWLAAFAAARPRVRLRTLEGGARGYCRAANEALLRSEFGDAVLLLNSDTIVSEGWIDRLLAASGTVGRYGVVGPLSNAASTQSLPDVKARADQTAINVWPDEMSLSDINALCRDWSEGVEAPIVPLVHGFCQLISRRMLTEIGGFDEALFPRGYGEENDLCFRGTDAGFRHVVALDCFVYHEKSKSYTDPVKREALMKAGGAALRSRHGEARVASAIKVMEGHPSLVAMREAARAYLSDRRQAVRRRAS